MKYVPHDYQAYCIQRVVEDPAVGLFLRPGLGKTVITLSAVNILKYFRWQVQKVLVVAPKKVAEATVLFHLANKVALNIAFFHGFPPFGTVEHSRVYVAQTGGLESFIFLYSL